VEEHRKKLEDIIKQISSLEKKAPGDRKSKDKIIQLKRELEKLLEKKEYLDAYEAIVRSEARAYKDNKRGKKKN
jgi:protein-arginine kinase activator protein McsA